MPVICRELSAGRVGRPGRERAGETHHDDEGAAIEEPSVDVGDEPDGECADRGGDVALVVEPSAGEVVRHPADARDGHEEVLQEDAIAMISTEEARSELDCSAYQFSAVPRRVLPQAQEEGV